MTRIWILVALLGVVGSACGSSMPVSQQEATATAAILEAVLAYQITQFVEKEPPARVCVQINGAAGTTDPSVELLGRLPHAGESVPGSECEVGGDRVVHRASGEAAVLIGAGPITWESPDEVVVLGRYFRSPTSSALPTYKVVRETEGWVCLGPVIEGLPL